MSTPNRVPEGHTCHPLAIVGSDVIAYTCHVCGRRWQRHYDETTKEGGPWREVEPGHPIDTETGGYWSGPSLNLVQRHWHTKQTVIAAATVVGKGGPSRHWTLALLNGTDCKFSVYRFWRGPGDLWCCTMLTEEKAYEVAVQAFQADVGRAISEVR